MVNLIYMKDSDMIVYRSNKTIKTYLITILCALFVCQASAVGANTSTLMHWSFDNDSANIALDESGNGNDGNLINSPLHANNGVATALDLNTTQYIEAGEVFDGIGDFSASLWFRTSTDNKILMQQLEDSSGAGNVVGFWRLRIVNGRILAEIQDTALNPPSAILSSQLYLDNQWHFVVMQREGDQLSIDIDNGSDHVEKANVSLDDISGGAPFRVSSKVAASRFTGGIDEIRIDDHALTATEISNRYTLDLQSIELNKTVLHWSFDNDTGTTAIDDSSNGNHGSLFNSPVYINTGMDTSINIDGSQYVETTEIFDGLGDFTSSLWFRTSTTNQTLVQQWENTAGDAKTNAYWRLAMGSNGQLYAEIRDATQNPLAGFLVSSVQSYNDNQWHFVYIQRQQGTLILDIDDASERIELANVTQADISSGAPFRTSAKGIGGAFVGEVDDVRFNQVALYGPEISQRYWNNLRSIGRNSLLHWTFSNDNGTLVEDTSGYGNSGVLVNNPVYGSGGVGQMLSLAANQRVDANEVFDGIGDFSVSFWFRTSSDSQTIVQQQQNSAGTGTLKGFWRLRIQNGLLFGEIGDEGTSTDLLRTNNSYIDNEWHFVVFQRKNDTLVLDLDNGVERIEQAGVTEEDISGGAPLRISNLGAVNNYLGDIDELHLDGYALSVADINTRYLLDKVLIDGESGNCNSEVIVSIDGGSVCNPLGPQSEYKMPVDEFGLPVILPGSAWTEDSTRTSDDFSAETIGNPIDNLSVSVSSLNLLPGEYIDALSGVPSLTETDLLWGGKGLPIQISRTLDFYPEEVLQANSDGTFIIDQVTMFIRSRMGRKALGDWQLNIPHVEVGLSSELGVKIFPGRVYGFTGFDRAQGAKLEDSRFVGLCRQPRPWFNLASPQHNELDATWRGVYVRGLSSGQSVELLTQGSAFIGESSSTIYRSLSNWQADCMFEDGVTSGDVKNGFRVRSADGLVYEMTKIAKPSGNPTLTPFVNAKSFQSVRLYVTKILDPTGNYLEFEYYNNSELVPPIAANSQPDYNVFLKKIRASDGREVEFTYSNYTMHPAIGSLGLYLETGSQRRLTQVVAKNINDDGTDRVFTYDYSDRTDRLLGVTAPMGRQTTYSHTKLDFLNNKFTVNYPDGGQLNYKLQIRRLPRATGYGTDTFLESDGSVRCRGNSQDMTRGVLDQFIGAQVIDKSEPFVISVVERELITGGQSSETYLTRYLRYSKVIDIVYDEPRIVIINGSFYNNIEVLCFLEHQTVELAPDSISHTRFYGKLDTFNEGLPFYTATYAADALDVTSWIPPFTVMDSEDALNELLIQPDQSRTFTFYTANYFDRNEGFFRFAEFTNCLGFNIFRCPPSFARTSIHKSFVQASLLVLPEPTAAESTIYATFNYWHMIFGQPKVSVRYETSVRSNPRVANGDESNVKALCVENTYKNYLLQDDLWLIGLPLESKQYIGFGPSSNIEHPFCLNGDDPFAGTSLAGVFTTPFLTSSDEPIVTRKFTYDTSGRVLSSTQSGNIVTSATYYSNNSPSADAGEMRDYIDSVNGVTTFSDYYRGSPGTIKQRGDLSQNGINIIGSQVINNDGSIASTTNPNGNSSNFEYDDIGRLERVVFPPITGQVNQADLLITRPDVNTRISTTGNLQTTEKTDGFGRPTLSIIGSVDSSVAPIYQTTQYNENSQIIFTSYPSLSNSSTTGVVTQYDALGRTVLQSLTVDPVGVGVRTEYLGHSTIKSTSAAGNEKIIYARAYGGPGDSRVTAVNVDVSADNNSSCADTIRTEMDLNQLGAKRSIRQGCWLDNAQGGSFNGTSASTHSYGYDDRFLLTSHDMPERDGVTSLYDDSGKLIHSYTQGIDIDKVSFIYDEFSRLVETNYLADPQLNTVITYDKNSNITKASVGATVRNSVYDELDRLTHHDLEIDGYRLGLNYRYNAEGDLERLIYPTGKIIEYAPDALGRLTKVSDYVSNVSYHPTGQVMDYTSGNGVVTSYLLNDKQLIEDIVASKDSVAYVDLSYQFTLDNQVKRIDNWMDSSESRSMTYDTVGRLNAVDYFNSATTPWKHSYDALSNLTSLTTDIASINYNYDPVSNRIDNVQGASNSSVYSYDRYGNTINNTKYAFNYNAAQQLESIDGQASYAYDVNGLRVKTIENGSTVYSLHLNNVLLFEYNPTDGWLREYYYMGSTLVAQRKLLDANASDSDGDGISDRCELIIDGCS